MESIAIERLRLDGEGVMTVSDVEQDYLPVRSVNEYVFCPRLFWLEEVAGEFEDNEHTIEGQDVHRNVDRPGGSMPAPEDDDGRLPEWHTRSLWLSDDEVGVSGKIDLVELVDENLVMPVDYKKGTPPPDGGMWDTDRVQLTLEALLLRAHGYDCESIAVWYHGSRKRVERNLTDEIIDRARKAVDAARQAFYSRKPPAPLEDSPKCRGCSLSAICQPDEVNALDHDHLAPNADDEEIRRIVPPRDDAVPLYVHSQGAYVRKSGHCLKVDPPEHSDQEEYEAGLGRVSQLNLMGAVQVSTQAMQTCLRNEIPVAYFSSSGWFYGLADPVERKQVHRRIAQHEARETELAGRIASAIVADKIHNGRTLIRRNADDKPTEPLADMARCRDRAEGCTERDELLGIEGTAARAYWDAFNRLVSVVDEKFEMDGRNRRPPEDPVNAMLSYAYSILTKDCMLAVRSVGLDPHLGLFHTSHHGRPAVALDLMEIFRPLIVDSAVLRLVRRGDVQPKDFEQTGQAVAMKKAAKGALIREYERRMDSLVTHPVFGYRISYRRTLYVHARLLGRVLTGEIDELPNFRNR